MLNTRLSAALGIALAALPILAAGASGRACSVSSRALFTPVIELYTSEGCDSCPPADRWFSGLKNEAARGSIVPLAFHVDYWDYIGWKDPYASKFSTKRQKQYAESFKLSFVYTPQMVVNGLAESVGSDRAGVETAVEKAKARPSAHPSLVLERRSDGGLLVHVGAAETRRPATVWLACFDRQKSTAVPRGENAGSTLTNYHIVRHFESLGTWKGTMLDLSVGPDEVEEYAGLPDQDLAVLLQTDGVGPILAAVRLGTARP